MASGAKMVTSSYLAIKGSSKCQIADLLPVHLARELRSDNMKTLNNATLCNPGDLPDDKKYTVKGDEIGLTDVHLKVIKQDRFTEEYHMCLMADTLGAVFDYRRISDVEAFALFLQSLIHIFGKKVLTTGNLATELRKSGVDVVLEEVNLDDPIQVQALVESPAVRKLRAQLNLDDVNNPRIILLAYCGTILLLAGKQLSDISAKSWTERRIVGLAASMDTAISAGMVVPFNHLIGLQIYHQVCFHHVARSTMVRILLGSCKNPGLAGAISSAMLNLLAWSEMNHIRMIWEYLLRRYPELLSMHHLQGYSLGVLKAALKYLGSLDEAERPYAKLLYTPQQTKALQRDRFSLLTEAAHAVGNHLHASFTNYKGDTVGILGSSIKRIVTEYLVSLDAKGSTMAKAAQYATIDKRIVDNIDKAEAFFQ